MLEEIWIRSHRPGAGTIYIMSGFANYNGGARFYRTFKEHTENGGKIIAILGGSATQNTSSRQVVGALLDCGAEVNITNRKSLMHAKCYGVKIGNEEKLIVSSGNFTGPGMAQNVEAALLLDSEVTANIGFAWDELVTSMFRQSWQTYRPTAITQQDPVWNLLYDETPGIITIDQSEKLTLVVKLGHADTARIMARPGTNESLGSQYFWLSKDCFDFFPPLTIRNQRGYKGTLSTLITLHYIDLGRTDDKCRVTFEAENNFDFRLGTGLLRYTRLAEPDDLACISRIGEAEYELRILKKDLENYNKVLPYATTFIGARGKMYGFIDNQRFGELTGLRLGVTQTRIAPG
jgi:HKD family nuclease